MFRRMRQKFTRSLYYPLTQKLKNQRVLSYLAELQQSERLSQDELHILQMKRLKDHLCEAANSRFYRDLFGKCGFDPQADFAGFSRLPITTKNAVRDDPEGFHNPVYRGKLSYGKTSGTTGASIKLIYDSEWDQRNQAAQLRGRNWWNIYPGSRELNIWGRPFSSAREKLIIDLKMGLLNRRLINSFQMSAEQLSHLLPVLAKFDPDIIYAYSTAVGRLAEFILQRYGKGNSPLKPRVIIVSTEMLMEHHAEAVNQAFGIGAINEYGSAEAGIISFECPEGNWHLAADNQIVEIIDPDSAGNGKVVVTPLGNKAMPLVRYELGDIGELSTDKCPCGRTLPLFRLTQGRVSDLIITPSGNVSSPAFFTYIAKSLMPEGLQQFRVIQKSLSDFRFFLVYKGSGREIIEERIKQLSEQYLGSDVNIQFRYVDEIKPEPSGKLRYFIRENFN